jgi:hypothetical protein
MIFCFLSSDRIKMIIDIRNISVNFSFIKKGEKRVEKAAPRPCHGRYAGRKNQEQRSLLFLLSNFDLSYFLPHSTKRNVDISSMIYIG